jgi:arylsulfatase A-like enzyme
MKVFLIIFDTLRKDHTGHVYGNEWIKTPNFDEFAKDCLVFEKAYPESLPTIPVRRAIHTGIRTFPFNHEKPKLRTDDGVFDPGWDPIPPHHKQIGEYMKDFKYITAFITSTYHQFKPNMNFHIGFDQFNWIRGHEMDKLRAKIRMNEEEVNELIDNYTLNGRRRRALAKYQKYLLERYLANVQDRKKEEDYFPGQSFSKGIEFVKDTEGFDDTFCIIDEFDPHEPWDPPNKYLEIYSESEYSGPELIQPVYSERLKKLTDDEIKCMRDHYAGEVSMCDRWFGEFISELKNMRIYDDSLIFFISDHGHSIGDHSALGKIPMAMYPELVDIPFMIKPPGNLDGPKRINKSYVYNHDILPTIFGFLNKEIPEVFEGKDLSVFIDGDDHLLESREYITCGFSVCTLYKDDNFALITSNDKNQRKLFNLSKDPEWNKNIADGNDDIYEDLFEKIERDANYDLLTDVEHTTLEDLKDWYYQKQFKDNQG